MPAFRSILSARTLDGVGVFPRQQAIFAAHPSPNSRPLPSPLTLDTFESACDATTHRLDQARLVTLVSRDPETQAQTERALFDALHGAGEFELTYYDEAVGVSSAVESAYNAVLNPGPKIRAWRDSQPYAPVSADVWCERAIHEGLVVELWFGARRIERFVETYGDLQGAQFIPLGDAWPLEAAWNEATAWAMAGAPRSLAGACLLSFEYQYWMINQGAWTARLQDMPWMMPAATIVRALQDYLLVPPETAVAQQELERRTYLMEIGADLLCLVTDERAVARTWYGKTLAQSQVLGMTPGYSAASQVVRLQKKIACL